jgi:hypothetical protein
VRCGDKVIRKLSSKKVALQQHGQLLIVKLSALPIGWLVLLASRGIAKQTH